MSTEKPLISILMCTYNMQDYVRESIDSMLNQTLGDFEFIIMEDGSTDNTVEIIESYTDPRIRLIRNEQNLGFTNSLNKGIDLARGKYIARMDSDDISMPERLQKQFDFMEQYPEVGVSGTWFTKFGDSQHPTIYKTKHEEIILQLLYQTHICHAAAMFRTDVLIENNIRYNPEFITAQDYDMWTRLIPVCKLANIPEVLVAVRYHKQSASAAKREQQARNHNKIVYNLLHQVGVDLPDEHVALFISFCDVRTDFSMKEIDVIEKILLSILEANERSRFYKPESINNFLCSKWFHTCYNSRHLGMSIYQKYFNSKLYEYQPVGIAAKAKFFIKSLVA